MGNHLFVIICRLNVHVGIIIIIMSKNQVF